jgi:hypothetical protein
MSRRAGASSACEFWGQWELQDKQALLGREVDCCLIGIYEWLAMAQKKALPGKPFGRA